MTRNQLQLTPELNDMPNSMRGDMAVCGVGEQCCKQASPDQCGRSMSRACLPTKQKYTHASMHCPEQAYAISKSMWAMGRTYYSDSIPLPP